MRDYRGWVLRGALAASAALALAGCYKGNFTNCAVTCATSSDCPSDLACSPQGLCSAGGASCEGMIPMPDADLNQPQSLDVTRMGDGSVVSTPAGIDCGSTCTSDFPPLSSVMLTATPGTGSVFEGWTGDCAGSTTTDCSLTMDGPKIANVKFAQHAALRWVKQISFPGDAFDGGIATDDEGNVISAGSVDDNGTATLYVIKYAKADGSTIWEKKIPTGEVGTDVAAVDTDDAGNVYLCSRLTGLGGMATIGSTVVHGDLFGNILAIRLAAADGAIDWVKEWGGTGQEVCGGLVVSGTNVWVTGYTSSSPSMFDGVVLSGASTNSAFLVKAGTTNGTAAAGQLLNGNFSIYAIGENGGKVAIGGAARSASMNVPNCNLGISGGAGTDHGFIMAFDSNLTCTFVKVFGSNVANQPTDVFGIAGVPGGDWVTVGTFQGPVLFATSGSSIPNQGGNDAFIARYTSTGNHVYSFGYGTNASEVGRSVAVTSTGEIVFAGEFGSSITFGSSTLTGTNDLFLTRLSSGVTPIHQWSQKIGGTAGEVAHNVSLGPDGTVNLGAYWTGMSDVLGTPLTGQGYDSWVGSFVR